jgi:hypothetical protein
MRTYKATHRPSLQTVDTTIVALAVITLTPMDLMIATTPIGLTIAATPTNLTITTTPTSKEQTARFVGKTTVNHGSI